MNALTYKYSSIKPLAISLRLAGQTYTEISEILGPIPKGTLNGWFKNIVLTAEQKERIKNKMQSVGHHGRQKGAWANRQKRIDRLSLIEADARRVYLENCKHPLFLAGLMLYLAEGSKKTEAFMFMNSDFNLIRTMMIWIENFSNIKISDMKFRLYIHELYANENCEDYWMEKLKINKEQFMKTIYKPNIRKYKKNPAYKGCMRLEIKGSEVYWKTMFWRDCFYESLNA